MLLLSPLGTKRVGPSIQDLSDLPTAEHKERRRQLGECFQRKINFFSCPFYTNSLGMKMEWLLLWKGKVTLTLDSLDKNSSTTSCCGEHFKIGWEITDRNKAEEVQMKESGQYTHRAPFRPTSEGNSCLRAISVAESLQYWLLPWIPNICMQLCFCGR